MPCFDQNELGVTSGHLLVWVVVWYLSLSWWNRKRGEEPDVGFWGKGFLPFRYTIRNIINDYPSNKEETKLYHGLQRRWHSHIDAASVVSGHPLIAPLFCQFPSEDLSSRKRSKLVLASFFFFSFQFLIDLLLLEHSGKKTSGPEAELCLGGFSCHSWWKSGLNTLFVFFQEHKITPHPIPFKILWYKKYKKY